MHENTPGGALTAFIDSLLQSTGQLMLIVDHMANNPGDPESPPVDVVLRELVEGILAPEVRGRSADVATATSILTVAREVIGRELFLVPPGALPERAASVARQDRMRRRRPV